MARFHEAEDDDWEDMNILRAFWGYKQTWYVWAKSVTGVLLS